MVKYSAEPDNATKSAKVSSLCIIVWAAEGPSSRTVGIDEQAFDWYTFTSGQPYAAWEFMHLTIPKLFRPVARISECTSRIRERQLSLSRVWS